MSSIEQHPAQETADAAMATAAIISPVWMELIQDGMGVYVMIGGAILLTLRIIKAVKDLMGKRKERKHGDRSTP